MWLSASVVRTGPLISRRRASAHRPLAILAPAAKRPGRGGGTPGHFDTVGTGPPREGSAMEAEEGWGDRAARGRVTVSTEATRSSPGPWTRRLVQGYRGVKDVAAQAGCKSPSLGKRPGRGSWHGRRCLREPGGGRPFSATFLPRPRWRAGAWAQTGGANTSDPALARPGGPRACSGSPHRECRFGGSNLASRSEAQRPS